MTPLFLPFLFVREGETGGGLSSLENAGDFCFTVRAGIDVQAVTQHLVPVALDQLCPAAGTLCGIAFHVGNITDIAI